MRENDFDAPFGGTSTSFMIPQDERDPKVHHGGGLKVTKLSELCSSGVGSGIIVPNIL